MPRNLVGSDFVNGKSFRYRGESNLTSAAIVSSSCTESSRIRYSKRKIKVILECLEQLIMKIVIELINEDCNIVKMKIFFF